MNNREFMDIMKSCGKVPNIFENNMDLICGIPCELNLAYKVLDRYIKNYILIEDSNRLLWMILNEFSSICYNHYYDGDYMDVLNTVLEVFTIQHSVSKQIRGRILYDKFRQFNKVMTYRLNLRYFRNIFVSIATDTMNNPRLKYGLSMRDKENYLILDKKIKCNYCFIKDGDLKYKEFKLDDHINTMEFLLNGDYDYIYMPLIDNFVIIDKVLDHYKKVEIDNTRYVDILNFMRLLRTDDPSIWKELDDLLNKGVDLRIPLYTLIYNRGMLLSEQVRILENAISEVEKSGFNTNSELVSKINLVVKKVCR